jgi:sensor histidine kinase regulating citrate/malate metabolism
MTAEKKKPEEKNSAPSGIEQLLRDDAEKERIFERGFGKDTGVGLALSREILSITGIPIKETGEPGKGARFEMTVPKGAYRLQEVR